MNNPEIEPEDTRGMGADAMREALEAIEQEAGKLLAMNLPDGIEPRISLIHSIARHQHDVRDDQETEA